MLAIGCLFPFLLLLAGAIIGGTTGGATDSLIGAVIGLGIGLSVPAIILWVLHRAAGKREKRQDS